jgi:pimeloyl-ACP methyl ester carboxylesterase
MGGHRTIWLLALASLGLAGCATVPHEVFCPKLRPEATQMIFAVDGAGGWRLSTHAIQTTIESEHPLVQVECYEWSHGWGRLLADEIDHAYCRAAGQRLAEQVLRIQEAHPEAPISLIGHSAGSYVVLTAAECLPANSLAHLVLLAPAVTAKYDLRPALRATRGGVDVFYSGRDVWFLWLGVGIAGTTEGRGHIAAGRVGFRPVIESSADRLLYTGLRQHAWDSSMCWAGNYGGHAGCYSPDFLSAYVLPCLDLPGPIGDAMSHSAN